ncbi:hypothetical protein LCGC14_0458010 [marine sediment metagenome]|uniref:Uncharacterized protein n=1 Tax=marine sediment metagenome TaxID=412755 RepID=A0A0F9VPU7_9ZZZZ
MTDDWDLIILVLFLLSGLGMLAMVTIVLFVLAGQL